MVWPLCCHELSVSDVGSLIPLAQLPIRFHHEAVNTHRDIEKLSHCLVPSVVVAYVAPKGLAPLYLPIGA